MTKQCSILIYDASKDGDTPSSWIRMEIGGDIKDFEKFSDDTKDELGTYEYYGDDDDDLLEESQLMVQLDEDGNCSWNISLDLGEEDLIFLLLHHWKESAYTVREINFRGTVYTDIGDLEYLEDVVVYKRSSDSSEIEDWWRNRYSNVLNEWKSQHGIEDRQSMWKPRRFPAKKDGCDVYVYYFNESALSNGIVEVKENQRYIGAYYDRRKCEEILVAYETFWDEEDNKEIQIPFHTTYVETDNAVHIFLETDGNEVTFSVLLDGKLYKKISKNDENIIFYYTPFDKDKLSFAEFKQGENPEDMIFQKTEDGKYQCSIKNKNIRESISITPPKIPDWDGMDQDSARGLFKDYVCALYKAFLGVQKYYIGAYCFKHQPDTDLFSVKIDDYGFEVYGVLREPADLFALRTDECLLDMIGKLEYATDLRCIKERYEVSFDIECVYCVEDDIMTSLIPGVGSDLIIKVGEASPNNYEKWEGEPNAWTFFELQNDTWCFNKENLPDIKEFQCDGDVFVDELDTYSIIKDAVVRFYKAGGAAGVAGKVAWENMTSEEMKKRLYGDDMIPDQDVVAFALEMRNEFIRSNKIPNIAVIGEAGIGKSTLVDRFADAVFGKKVKTHSPSDLKAPYIGQTKYETLERLIQAAANKQIFFIDEAYMLTSDQFGHEAVALLLPLMTGDKNIGTLSARIHENTITYTPKTGEVTGKVYNDKGDIITQVPAGFPTIWIGGYEDDIRLMLKENQGLYRRFKRIALTSPTTEQLYEKMKKTLESELNVLSQPQLREKDKKYLVRIEDNVRMNDEIIEKLKKHLDLLLICCEKNKEMIIKFFRWGTQPQNSKYFANYAGVENFISRCLDGINFGTPEERKKPKYAEDIKGQMEAVISEIKRDIKHQLDTVRRKGNIDRNHPSSGNVDATEQVEMIVDNKTRFSDLVGCDSQRQYMQSIIEMLLKKDEYERFGITVPKGALLMGPPGVGKTFIARAMAGELQEQFEAKDPNKTVGFMSLSAPELTTKPVSFIGSIFDKAEEFDVCVIFIDEVDAIAKKRFQNGAYSHFIELIKQMDGVEQRSNVFVLAATNAPESLDPAFTRSGRIDKKLEFDLPDDKAIRELTERNIIKRIKKLNVSVKEKNGRKALENKDWARKVKKLSRDIAENLSGRGCTPGDVENIVNTAFIMYDNPQRQAVLDPAVSKFGSIKLAKLDYYLHEAAERHFIGDPGRIPENETFNSEKNNDSRSAVAVHEVGHALVRILHGYKPFEKITCLPRGEALGYVTPSKEELFTKEDFKNRICSAMGGRIAEEIVYGKDNISTGASADMRQATYIARLMVERWGFADEFEFMVLQEDTARYLGGSEYSCSESFREQSDRAVNDLLKKLYQETKEMLADKKELILLLAEEVFNQKSMTGVAFTKFYEKNKNNQ